MYPTFSEWSCSARVWQMVTFNWVGSIQLYLRPRQPTITIRDDWNNSQSIVGPLSRGHTTEGRVMSSNKTTDERQMPVLRKVNKSTGWCDADLDNALVAGHRVRELDVESDRTRQLLRHQQLPLSMFASLNKGSTHIWAGIKSLYLQNMFIETCLGRIWSDVIVGTKLEDEVSSVVCGDINNDWDPGPWLVPPHNCPRGKFSYQRTLEVTWLRSEKSPRGASWFLGKSLQGSPHIPHRPSFSFHWTPHPLHGVRQLNHYKIFKIFKII